MLSNESAVGKYPVETVKTMANIIVETEKSAYDDLALRAFSGKKTSVDEVISQISRLLGEEVGAKLILVASLSGETARLISRHRPELPIVVATGSDRVMHQLNLSWGVKPFILQPCRTIEELVDRSVSNLKKQKMVKTGDKIIVVAGEPVGQAGHVNLLEVREIQ
jgi:pyruvate kinase